MSHSLPTPELSCVPAGAPKFFGRKKQFIRILRDHHGARYGVDRSGTFWSLDKLERKGIAYERVSNTKEVK